MTSIIILIGRTEKTPGEQNSDLLHIMSNSAVGDKCVTYLATLARPLTRFFLSQPAPLERVCAWREWTGEICQNSTKSADFESSLKRHQHAGVFSTARECSEASKR